MLYLSAYFKTHKEEYYDRLQAVRDSGDVEGWMKFLLTAIWNVAKAAADTAHKILLMREEHRNLIHGKAGASSKAFELLDHLYREPYMTVKLAALRLDVSFPTASSIVSLLQRLDILHEVTGRYRHRIFRYSPYMTLMESGLSVGAPPQTEQNHNVASSG